jgi:hypothetical protein
MKISTPAGPSSINPIQKKSFEKTEKSGFFDKLLQQTFLKNTETDKTDIGINRFGTSPAIQPVILDGTGNTADLVKKLETCLNTLEEYSSQLADPQVPLCLLNKSIHELKTQTSRLSWESIPLNHNEDLKEIVFSLRDTVIAEINSFEKGDYVGLL